MINVGELSPFGGSASSGKVILAYIRKQAEQTMESKPVFFLWSLLEFLPSASCFVFLLWWTAICKPNLSFLPKVVFSCDPHHSTRKPSKTVF